MQRETFRQRACQLPIALGYTKVLTLLSWCQTSAWADDGIRMRVAINLSVHPLREDDLVDRIDRALRRHAIEPSQLLCEITAEGRKPAGAADFAPSVIGMEFLD